MNNIFKCSEGIKDGKLQYNITNDFNNLVKQVNNGLEFVSGTGLRNIAIFIIKGTEHNVLHIPGYNKEYVASHICKVLHSEKECQVVIDGLFYNLVVLNDGIGIYKVTCITRQLAIFNEIISNYFANMSATTIELIIGDTREILKYDDWMRGYYTSYKDVDRSNERNLSNLISDALKKDGLEINVVLKGEHIIKSTIKI